MARDCPTEAILARMLEDRLGPSEAGPVEAHVATCRACQAALERLTDLAPAKTESVWVDPTGRPARAPGASWSTRSGGPDEPEATRDGGPRGDEPPESPEIPGYRVDRELGRGGMGVVYLARQVHANRLVALKMVLSGRARPEDLIRFRVEGESLARLHHPNIVQVYDVGDHNGRPFFSMEYGRGGEPGRGPPGGTPPPPTGRVAGGGPGPGGPRRPPVRGGPSRPQARQHPDERREAPGRRRPVRPPGPQDHRLRPGQARRLRFGLDPHRADPGDPQLHGPRAGPGGGQRRGPGRRVCPGGDPLRGLDRTASVQGGHRLGHDDAGGPRAGHAAVPAPAGDPPRPGGDLPEGPGQGGGGSIRQRRRDGRGPPAVRGRRADPRPAGPGLGGRLEVGPPEAGGGPGGGHPPGGPGRAGGGGPWPTTPGSWPPQAAPTSPPATPTRAGPWPSGPWTG